MKFYLRRPTKILALSRYKMTRDGYLKIDQINFFRIVLMLGLVLSIVLFTTFDRVANASINQDANIVQVSHQPVITKAELQTKRIENFIKKNSKDLSNETIKEYSILAYKYATENKIDPYLLVGLIKVESSFNSYAISESNALGLTQVIPKWHKEKIEALKVRFGEFDIFDPEHNIALGAMVLKEYIRLHKGSTTKAISNYLGSSEIENAVYHNKVINAKRAAEQTST